ncbi:MAG: NAD(P)-dependent alcohol dehydrogenase [Chloroflexota bacterium]|nr:MAG: NAD(P)-dependent alcohol dehydrogenase [Chloroflexota bacterium]
MKAIVYEKYGPPDVLQLREVEKPTPSEDEVLVKVHAASVNYIDWQVLTGESLLLRVLNGLLKPKHKILGDDVAGRIEAVGTNVKQFQPGDEVFGISDSDGFAEYSCVNREYLGLKPANISFEEAAAVPYTASTALLGLRANGQIQPGQKVLINGASGGVGTFAVQIAKSFGAEVTGVCSTNKVDLVRSIGADHVVDYTQEDFTKGEQRYDLIFDVAAYRSIFDYRRALAPEGIYICAGGSMSGFFQAMLLGPLISMSGSKKLGSLGWVKPGQEDFAVLSELLEKGKIVAVIDKRFPLREVPEALRYYGSGHARGKIVITVIPEDKT